MELNKNEVEIVELVQREAESRSVTELSDLHLALVGGGIGTTAI